MIGPPRGKTAQESQADTTRITRRMFRAPNARRMVIPIGALSLLAGFLVDFPNVRWNAVLLAVVAFAIPAFASIAATVPLATVLGGRMYLRRSALLAFLGLVMVGAVFLVAVLVAVGLALGGAPYALPATRVALLGYGSIVYVRQVVLEGTSSTRPRALPAAVAHTVLGFAGVGLALAPPIGEWFLAAVFALAFYAAALAFTGITRRPLLRNFGVDGLSLLRYTLDHFTEQSDEARQEMESFFSRIAVPAKVRVGVVGFLGGRSWRSVLVAPMVHPGPMGTIGGSDLPAKVAKALHDLAPDVVVVHGPTTHDQNPASSAECDRIAVSVRGVLAAAATSAEAGPMVRATEGLATVSAQAFGESVLVTATLAPNPSDDIDSATGFAAVQEARLAGAREAVFVDAHNCMEVNSGLTLFGSPASHDILAATRRAVPEALRGPRSRLRVGVGRRMGFASPEEGIGARGVQAVVVEAAGQRAAYVVFDGNNMVPALRGELLSRLGALVDTAEALTTDNHSVNVTMGGFNPVGFGFDRARLVAIAEDVVREAVEGLAEVDAAVGAEWVDMRIFGPEATARLTTSVNATASILRPAFFLTFALGFASSALVALLI